MYEITKSVIDSKCYELTDMLKKINTIWIQGDITDEQKAELIALAQENADVTNSVDLMKKVEELDKRVRKLEEAQKDSEGDSESDGTDEEEGESELYPEYIVGKWYYNGDKCSEDGKNYICIAPEGKVCTWSPSEYPPYWQLVD